MILYLQVIFEVYIHVSLSTYKITYFTIRVMLSIN